MMIIVIVSFLFIYILPWLLFMISLGFVRKYSVTWEVVGMAFLIVGSFSQVVQNDIVDQYGLQGDMLKPYYALVLIGMAYFCFIRVIYMRIRSKN